MIKPWDWDGILSSKVESFRSQKIEDPSFPHSCFFSQEIGLLWASSCKAPRHESKINPWGTWVLELNEDFLNLLAYDVVTIYKESFQPSPKPQITLGRKIWEIKVSSWALHEQGWRCWWCPSSGADASFSSLLLLLQFLFQSFLSLVLGFILVLGL